MPVLRPATAADQWFLKRMLAFAADWRPGVPLRSPEQIMAEPALALYVAGWPAHSDVGVVAENDEAVGAAWWRFFSAREPGYGFVAETIPELAVGVMPAARGRGVGTMLVRALIDEAHRRGLPALSLSVEVDNPARELYGRLGFVTVTDSGQSLKMVLSLLQ
jgi:ribosomal protein S18 acetylase RimI-like enzyme